MHEITKETIQAKFSELLGDVLVPEGLSDDELLRLNGVFRSMQHMVTPGLIFQPYYGSLYKGVRLERLQLIARAIVEGLSSDKDKDKVWGKVEAIHLYVCARASLNEAFLTAGGMKCTAGALIELSFVVIGLQFMYTLFLAVPLLADSMYINQRFYDDCLWLLLHKEFLPDQLDSALENTRLLRNLSEGKEYVKHLKNPEEGLLLPKNICSRKINSDLRYIRSRNRVKAAVTLGVFIAVASVMLSNPITACAVSAYVMYAACGYLAASDIVDRCTKHQSLRGVVGTMFSCGKSAEPVERVSLSQQAK